MKNLKKIISVTAAAAMVMTTVAPVSVFADDATFKIGGIGPVTGAAAVLRKPGSSITMKEKIL